MSEISESVVSLAEGDFVSGSLEDIAVMGFMDGGSREGGWMLLNRVRSGLSVGEETAGCQGASVVAPGGGRREGGCVWGWKSFRLEVIEIKKRLGRRTLLRGSIQK